MWDVQQFLGKRNFNYGSTCQAPLTPPHAILCSAMPSVDGSHWCSHARKPCNPSPLFLDSGQPPCISGSSVSLIRLFVREFIHSFTCSFTHSLALPMSSCQRLGTEPYAGPMPPGRFRGQDPALLLIVLWQDLSLLVSESHVRAIPSDKTSPRLKLPVSSYLHQPISTCLSILMAYGSRGEISKWEKISNCAYWAKEND